MSLDEESEIIRLLRDLEQAASHLGEDDLGDAPTEFSEAEPTLIIESLQPALERSERLAPSLARRRELTRHAQTPTDASDTPEPGAIVDQRYRVVKKLLETPSGVVYAVEHLFLEHQFAMKLLDRRLSEEPQALQRFQAEARATGLTGHENIVFATDFGQCPAYGHYFVTELLEGERLSEIIARTAPCDLQTTSEVALAIGSALAAVHEVGVVHRDLQPQNIMRVAQPHRKPIWKLLNFGLPPGASDPRDTLFTGNPRYIAPEQAKRREGDERSDQFSLAIILFEMLTGEVPWPVRTPLEARHVDRSEILHLPSELRDDVLPAVDDVLRQALQEDPRARFGSVEAFLAAFQASIAVQVAPTFDPFDQREGTRQARAIAPDAASTFEEAPRSVIISVDDATNRLRVEFQSVARLRREYRRNIVVGGMFVPLEQPETVGRHVMVEVYYAPSGASVAVPARTVARSQGSKESMPGVGLAFDSEARAELASFLRDLELGLDLGPHDLIHPRRELRRDASLDPGAAYLMSRLTRTMKVATARAMFCALPYDFEEALVNLIDRGYVEVETAKSPQAPEETARLPLASEDEDHGRTAGEDSSASSASHQAAEASSFIAYSPDDVERSLELAEYFAERKNYMAAVDVLQRAVSHAADDVRLHRRLAILLAQFHNDLAGAREHVRRAHAIDPDDPEHETLARYIETLCEIEAVRTVFSKTWRGHVAHPVRTSSAIDRIWIELREKRGDGQILVAVDLARRQLISATRNPHPVPAAVIETDRPGFVSLDFAAGSRRQTIAARRRALLKKARESSSYGPWFRAGVAPVAVAPNGQTMVFEGHPQKIRPGVHLLVDEGRAPLALLPNVREVAQAAFSHDGQRLAVLGRSSATQPWCLFSGSYVGPLELRKRFEGDAIFAWADDGRAIYAVDYGARQLMEIDPSSGVLGLFRSERPLSYARFDDLRTTAVLAEAREGATRLMHVKVGSGKLLGEVMLKGDCLAAAVRADGACLVATSEGPYALDLSRGTRRKLVELRVDSASLQRAEWEEDKPLIVLGETDEKVEICSLDLDLLLGR